MCRWWSYIRRSIRRNSFPSLSAHVTPQSLQAKWVAVFRLEILFRFNWNGESICINPWYYKAVISRISCSCIWCTSMFTWWLSPSLHTNRTHGLIGMWQKKEQGLNSFVHCSKSENNFCKKKKLSGSDSKNHNHLFLNVSVYRVNTQKS